MVPSSNLGGGRGGEGAGEGGVVGGRRERGVGVGGRGRGGGGGGGGAGRDAQRDLTSLDYRCRRPRVSDKICKLTRLFPDLRLLVSGNAHGTASKHRF